MVSSFEKGFTAGIGLLSAELVGLAVSIFIAAGNTAIQQISPTSDAMSYVNLAIVLFSILNFIQTIGIGYGKSEEFLAGFLIGGFIALLISEPLAYTVADEVFWGIFTTIFGVIMGLVLKYAERQEYGGYY
jgi:hypothetical protein